MITAIAYIHGFNSSPASFKATLLRAEITRRAPQAVFIAPQLPHSPAAAAGLLENLARTHPRMVLVGSSLGGYYATWLAEKFALRAVLLNPAVRPYELLAGHIGRQKNLHTGEEYDFTAQHVAQLQSLEVDVITPQRYLLLAARDDEVLDYRMAVARYRDARQIVIDGGDHGLSNFADYVGTVLDFCGSTETD